MWTNKIKTKTKPSTSHSNWPRVLLFDLAHKQCNGIIKGWLHCLTSESKGRFLVNNVLMFGSAWCLIITQIQFSLIKRNKCWTSRTLATMSLATTPPFLRPITSHSCLTPHPVSRWISYVYHLLEELKPFRKEHYTSW